MSFGVESYLPHLTLSARSSLYYFNDGLSEIMCAYQLVILLVSPCIIKGLVKDRSMLQGKSTGLCNIQSRGT